MREFRFSVKIKAPTCLEKCKTLDGILQYVSTRYYFNDSFRTIYIEEVVGDIYDLVIVARDLKTAVEIFSDVAERYAKKLDLFLTAEELLEYEKKKLKSGAYSEDSVHISQTMDVDYKMVYDRVLAVL